MYATVAELAYVLVRRFLCKHQPVIVINEPLSLSLLLPLGSIITSIFSAKYIISFLHRAWSVRIDLDAMKKETFVPVDFLIAF